MPKKKGGKGKKKGSKKGKKGKKGATEVSRRRREAFHSQCLCVATPLGSSTRHCSPSQHWRLVCVVQTRPAHSNEAFYCVSGVEKRELCTLFTERLSV